MNKPKSKSPSVASARPKLGQSVVIRYRFVKPLTVGIIVGIYEEDTDDVVVQAFPVDRDSLQIPAIPFYSAVPDDDVQSAVWPA